LVSGPKKEARKRLRLKKSLEKAYFGKRTVLPEPDSAFLLADPAGNGYSIMQMDHLYRNAFTGL
jgi:hypothetical protein